MKKIFLIFFFWLLAFNLTQAATISFATTDRAVVGEEMAVELIIETDGENINALEGAVVWPADKLELVAVADQFSIVSLWIQDSRLATATAGRLPFAGLIPGGYGEPKGQILTLIFRPRLSGQAMVTVQEALIILNDGQGGSAPTAIQSFNLMIGSNQFLNPVWLYILFLIAGIITAIIAWRIIRRRKSGAV